MKENENNVVKTHTSLRTVPLSIPPLLHNSQLLCGIMWKAPLHHFTKTGQEGGKYEYKLTARLSPIRFSRNSYLLDTSV
jgi:hypothetical protein